MKTKISFSVLLLFCVLFFSFTKRNFNTLNESILQPSTNSGEDAQFLISAMHSGIDTAYTYYPDLGVNGWHKYTAPSGWGWPNIPNDNYDVPTSQYADAVLERMDRNRQNGLRSIMDRPKIQYTAYGQRSDYQCEAISEGADHWFYSYNTSVIGTYISDITDNSIYGSGAKVKYCQTIPSSPGSNAGYIVKDLRSNREQANKFWTPWMNDDTYAWYVMPRIRMDSAFVNNPSNQTIPVCRIEILNWNGDTIKKADIKVRNFRHHPHPDSIYNGNYLEEFFFTEHQDTSNLEITAGEICPGFKKYFWDWGSTNDTNTVKTDFRVYWYGQCDMWIDYVRVENFPARRLFSGEFDQDIREETQLALNDYDPDNPIPNNFYIEEFEFNIVPCVAYLNNLIMDESNGKLSLMVNLNYPLFKTHIPFSGNYEFSSEKINEYLVERAGLKYLVNVSYPLEGWETWEERKSYHPTTLSTSEYSKEGGILSHPATVNFYEDNFQWKLDFGDGSGDRFTKIMQKTDSIAKYYSPDLKLIHLAQAHMWWAKHHTLKEPSNEEISAMVNLSITYGAKGIMYFAYNSENGFDHPDMYERGLTELNKSPRYSSVYGQNKWEGVQNINSVLSNWGPHLISFDNENRKSYIYRLSGERVALLSQTYFSDIVTFKPAAGGPPPCEEDDPGGTWPGLVYECADKRYLQVATFQNTEPNSQYFMIVNRRCAPYLNASSEDQNGGRRNVKIKLDANSSSFAGFNNWHIIDLDADTIAATFDKRTSSWIDLDWYLPGQGKLYKVAPVMQEGGTLVADEEVNSTFNCKGMVYSTDKDIYLGSSTEISFAAGTGINMSGGTFQCGEDVVFSPSPELKGKDQNTVWQGIELSECRQVMIYKTVFSNIAAFRHAVTMTDCFDFNISNNSFSLYNTIKVGSVSADYYFQTEPREILAFYNNNTVTLNTSTIETFRCYSYGSANIPLMMNGNIFDAQSASTAISLFNIGEAVIKNSTINNYGTGIRIFGPASYADLYSNIINSGLTGSKGIIVTEGSVNLAPDGIYHTGGYNEITNSGSDGYNIELDHGYFNAHVGENTFNLTDLNLTGFHFTGIFQYETSGENAAKNCFQFDYDPTYPSHNVINPDSYDPVDFDFDPTTCSPEEFQSFEIFSLGGGEVDTVYMESSGGTGGAFPSTVIPADLSTEALAQVELYNEINIEMRKRNYEDAYDRCNNFLDLYIENEKALNVLSKLYLSSLMLDSAGSKMTPLKSYFEDLILTYGSNEKLVRKTFYLLQKCKASLGMYSDAMNGFQQIINQNPYSYLGLAAKWDYMAVHLLDSLSGIGGGLPDNTAGTEFKLFDDKPREINLKSDYDKKFDMVQREQINNNIKRSLTGSREDQIEAVKELVKKVQQGDKRSAIELDKRNRLNEAVTIRKPNNVTEHRNIIREDIEKVFATAEGLSGTAENLNIIPIAFELYQNFPNPFNPATKIKFDLPQNTKVTLKIYDILGREMSKLVNNSILEAGVHTYDFHASSLASGVYFYRIESIDPGSNSVLFVKTKKMVIVK